MHHSPGERQRLTDEAALQHEKLRQRLADKFEMWGVPRPSTSPAPKRPAMSLHDWIEYCYQKQKEADALEREEWREELKLKTT